LSLPTSEEVLRTKITVFSMLIKTKEQRNLKFFQDHKEKEGTFTPEEMSMKLFKDFLDTITSINIDSLDDLIPLATLLEFKDNTYDWRINPLIKFNQNIQGLKPGKYLAQIISNFVIVTRDLTRFKNMELRISVGEVTGLYTTLREIKPAWTYNGECFLEVRDKQAKLIKWRELSCQEVQQ